MPPLIRSAREVYRGWLLPALEQFTKAEIKLIAIGVCTILISVAASILFSLHPVEIDADADVYECKPALGEAMQRWVAEQGRVGVAATLVPFPGRDVAISAAPIRYHIHYAASGLALLKLKLAEVPLPEPFSGNCKLSRYFWTSKDNEQSMSARAVELMLPLYAAIALLVPWSLRARRESLVPGVAPRQGLRSIPLWCLPLGVATCAAALLFVRVFAIDMASVRDTSAWQAVPWIGTLLAIVAAPIFEELLFRRWLLESFLRANLLVFGSIVVSLNFALLHLTRYVISATFFATLGMFFGISLVLCWVYARTRNVLACMAVHCAHNASALIAAALLP